MGLINRDELELDTEWSDYYDGFTSYSQSQIKDAVEVQAIPLDKVKKAREEIDDLIYVESYVDSYSVIENVLAILDKLIEEGNDTSNS